jgi:hypothetical protein
VYAVGVLSVSGGSWRIAAPEFSHDANGIGFAARMEMLRFGRQDCRASAVKPFGDWGLW